VEVRLLDASGFLARQQHPGDRQPTMFREAREPCLTGPIAVRGARPDLVLSVQLPSRQSSRSSRRGRGVARACQTVGRLSTPPAAHPAATRAYTLRTESGEEHQQPAEGAVPFSADLPHHMPHSEVPSANEPPTNDQRPDRRHRRSGP
jgi:hypothetical protein